MKKKKPISQLNFFDVMFGEETIQVEVTTYCCGDHFIATLNNWWLGTGKTSEAAVKSVLENFKLEMDLE